MSTTGAMERVRGRSIGSDFRSVWLSVIVSSTGDGMFVTALPLLAAVLTKDPVLISGITVAQRLPWLLLSMVTGAAADRMDRRRLMIGADVARFVIVGLLGVAVLTDVANIWMLYASAFLLGVGETLHVNAAQALVPAIVAHDDLLQANARFGSGQIAAAQFVGPPLGVAAFNAGASLPFIGDAISFAGSAALVASLPDVHHVEPSSSRVRDDVREGFGFMWRNVAIRRMTVILAAINFFYFAAIALLVLYNDETLHGSDATYTAMFLAAATGTVLARFYVTWVSIALGRVRTLVAAVWLWAASLVALAVAPAPWMAIAGYFLLGSGTGLWWAVNTTVRQQLTPTRLLGRQNAAYRTVSWGIVPVGAAFGGLVAKWYGLRAPFVMGGVAMVLIAVAASRYLRPVSAALADAAGLDRPVR